MKSQSIVAYGAPLAEVTAETPVPTGDEVLLEVRHCGVCHSDVHLHDGAFDLGGGKKLDASAGRALPFALGHEVAGIVVARGETARIPLGEERLVFPWIGCGACAVCAASDEHLCAKPRSIGVNAPGGFATHVLVPRERYLLRCEGVPPDLGATYMCSGLTAFSALKKLEKRNADQSVLIVGLGGVGMMALQFAQTLTRGTIYAADVDPLKLEAGKVMDAHEVFDAAAPDAAKAIQRATGGGVAAAIDFVGSESSIKLATSAVRRGGQVVVVGMFGGSFSMPIPFFPMRALRIEGSFVGSLAEAREMLDLVREGRVRPIPVERRPMSAANASLDDLRAGRVVGRVVLCNEANAQ